MKKNWEATLFYLASFGFYLAALIGIYNGTEMNRNIIWLCLGSSMLCLGSSKTNQVKKKDKQEQQKSENLSQEDTSSIDSEEGK